MMITRKKMNNKLNADIYNKFYNSLNNLSCLVFSTKNLNWKFQFKMEGAMAIAQYFFIGNGAFFAW